MPGILFPLGDPVSEKDIVDREDFLVSLGTRLQEGQSIMLAGPRRIGKTSLALEVLRRLKSKESYIAFVDLFRYTVTIQVPEIVTTKKGCKGFKCASSASPISRTLA